MKSLVIDGSTTLDILLKDEQSSHAIKTFKALEDGCPAYVPTHWWVETANGLMMAERHKRATQAEIMEALHLIQMLPVMTDDQTAQRCGDDTISLARQYGLTVYDAAYLELAIRRRSILATTDQALAKAAAKAGVEVMK